MLFIALKKKIAIVPSPLMLSKSKKKFTADAAKCVLRTVHTYPSPEVFLRSVGKWGGLLPRFFLSNVRIVGDSVANTVLRG
jgi:hypothetical protein